jgi:DNA polymerase-3 subunit gamma/tau
MALIRLAYAAELPPTDKLLRDVLDGAPSRAPAESGKAPSRGPAMVAQDPSAKMPSPSAKSPSAFSTLAQGESSGRATMSAAPAIAPDAAVEPTVRINSLEELAALAQRSGAPVLRVQIENNIRLVRLEPGHLEFAPTPAAPRTLAGDLAQKLKEWTGVRWSVIVAREGGQPTIAEQKRQAKAARLESVLQEPFVRAVLDRFPGAEVIAVRDLAEEEIAAPMPDKDS